MASKNSSSSPKGFAVMKYFEKDKESSIDTSNDDEDQRFVEFVLSISDSDSESNTCDLVLSTHFAQATAVGRALRKSEHTLQH